MRDPLTWSLPIGRAFGITIRVHLLFFFFAIIILFRGMRDGVATDACILMLLTFVCVLMHEFGHCFAGRYVGGDASDILLWPLGGLAYVDVPNTPRANFITVAGGPAVNLLFCGLAGGALAVYQYLPPMSPFWYPFHFPGPASTAQHTDWIGPYLWNWSGEGMHRVDSPAAMPVLLARLFYVNWLQFWFNMLLVGFPLDGGRILQCILWPRIGFRQATRVVIVCGWIVALVLAIYASVTMESATAFSSLLMFMLALFVFDACRQHAVMLESGALSEDGALGYDFSQGYTSLERGEPSAPPRRRRAGFWQRWWQRRAARKRQREHDQRVAEERRLDELLVKVERHGTLSLTDEERRFLTRVSAKYRNRSKP